MSSGIVVCSTCRREIHQNGQADERGRATWTHCDDKSPRCSGAKADYPKQGEPLGQWCGVDGMGFLP